MRTLVAYGMTGKWETSEDTAQMRNGVYTRDLEGSRLVFRVVQRYVFSYPSSWLKDPWRIAVVASV